MLFIQIFKRFHSKNFKLGCSNFDRLFSLTITANIKTNLLCRLRADPSRWNLPIGIIHPFSKIAVFWDIECPGPVGHNIIYNWRGGAMKPREEKGHSLTEWINESVEMVVVFVVAVLVAFIVFVFVVVIFIVVVFVLKVTLDFAFRRRLYIRVSLKAPLVKLKILTPIFLFHLVQSFRFFFWTFFRPFFLLRITFWP